MILTIKDPEVFDALVSGKKRYEGRRWKEDYTSLSPGDLLLFVLEGGQELLVSRVTEVRRYPSVEAMVRELWRDLLPFVDDVETALRYYSRFYSLSDPAVAFGVEPVSRFTLDSRSLSKWLGMGITPLRVAVGMEGGNLFSGHFGDSPEFWIFEVTPDGWRLVERRKNTTEGEEEHGHHHGDPKKFRAVYSLLSDADVWVAFRMGPNYVRIVRETSIIPFIAGTRNLDEALERVRRKFLSLFLRRQCHGDRGGG